MTAAVKPDASWIFDPSLPLGDAAFYLLYNEQGPQLKEQVSGVLCPSDTRMSWSPLPDGLPWGGPFCDNRNPNKSNRAVAKFVQGGALLAHPLFGSGYNGALTVASISVGCYDGSLNGKTAYVIDNDGEIQPANPAAFNIYWNTPGFPGWIGETLRNNGGSKIQAAQQEYQFNHSDLNSIPFVVHVRVMRAGVNAGCDVWTNLDASGNDGGTMRKVATYASADVQGTRGVSPIGGLNGIGVWGTAPVGTVGSPAGYVVFGIWPRVWSSDEVQGFRACPWPMMRQP